jgi:NADH pyrophosphatase NudC (nudix superfamily)
MFASEHLHSLALKAWKYLPFPGAVQRRLLAVVNSTFLVGALAVIRDAEGRILLLHQTYRRQRPWGLPGGFIKRGEQAETALAREVQEETGYFVDVQRLLTASFCFDDELGMLFECRIIGGSYRNSIENSECCWAPPNELPSMPEHQRALLEKAGVLLPAAALPP